MDPNLTGVTARGSIGSIILRKEKKNRRKRRKRIGLTGRNGQLPYPTVPIEGRPVLTGLRGEKNIMRRRHSERRKPGTTQLPSVRSLAAKENPKTPHVRGPEKGAESERWRKGGKGFRRRSRPNNHLGRGPGNK